MDDYRSQRWINTLVILIIACFVAPFVAEWLGYYFNPLNCIESDAVVTTIVWTFVGGLALGIVNGLTGIKRPAIATRIGIPSWLQVVAVGWWMAILFVYFPAHQYNKFNIEDARSRVLEEGAAPDPTVGACFTKLPAWW